MKFAITFFYNTRFHYCSIEHRALGFGNFGFAASRISTRVAAFDAPDNFAFGIYVSDSQYAVVITNNYKRNTCKILSQHFAKQCVVGNGSF